MNKPNFIISGFAKCGTTALHYYLEAHPEIYMPKKKELHYFSQSNISQNNQGPGGRQANESFVKDFDLYLNLFKGVKSEKIIGETSPSYINYPDCFVQINKKLNDPKIIILIRDPIKRSYSNYLHLIREQRETYSFEKALDLEFSRKEQMFSDFWFYKSNSYYYEKILEAKRSFTNVLVVTQEELSSDTQNTLKKIYKFLGANTEFTPKNLKKKYNKGGLYKKNIITNFVFKQGEIKNLFKRVFDISPWMKDLKNRVISNFHYKPKPIDTVLEKKLIKDFQNEVMKIKSLGINTSLWNNKFFE